MKKAIFVVIIEEIFNQEMYKNYISQVVKVIQSHNGKYVARSNKITAFSGPRYEFRLNPLSFEGVFPFFVPGVGAVQRSSRPPQRSGRPLYGKTAGAPPRS